MMLGMFRVGFGFGGGRIGVRCRYLGVCVFVRMSLWNQFDLWVGFWMVYGCVWSDLYFFWGGGQIQIHNF